MQTIPAENIPATGKLQIRVGDSVIDEAAIAGEMQFHPAASQDAAARASARALVIQELLRQRAIELSMHSGDADSAHYVPSENDIAQMLERELQVPEPDDEACQRYYIHHPERFCEPPQYRVRHILLDAAPDDAEGRDRQYRQADKLIKTLNEHGERFTELAQRYSSCPSRDDGGELGWLHPGQTVDELDRALEHLPTGLHDRPLASRYGWHVVQIDERKEKRALSYEAVKNRVVRELTEQATRMALRHYLLALEAEIGVEGFSLDNDAMASSPIR